MLSKGWAHRNSRCRLMSLATLGAVLGLSLAGPALAQTVPGTSDPFLAGMPNGSTCCGGDSAPGQSPVLVSFAITPGSNVTFSVTGSVDNTGAPPSLTPDGAGPPFLTSSNNGIAGATWPINALVGVFLDASQPDSSPTPASLDFSASGVGTDFTTLSPALKQAFFIGDGLTGTGTGSVQNFVVPAGATRLFLGTSDGFGWFNNSGTFAVTVSAGPTAPSAAVPMLSLPVQVLLGIALAAAALFLIRRI